MQCLLFLTTVNDLIEAIHGTCSIVNIVETARRKALHTELIDKLADRRQCSSSVVRAPPLAVNMRADFLQCYESTASWKTLY